MGKGLLERKTTGAYSAENVFVESKDGNLGQQNQEAAIRMSNELMSSILAIKKIKNYKFNYQVLDMFVKEFEQSLSEEEYKKYQFLKEYL